MQGTVCNQKNQNGDNISESKRKYLLANFRINELKGNLLKSTI